MKKIFPNCAMAFAVATIGCSPKSARVYEAPKDRPFVPAKEDAGDQKTAEAPEQWRPALAWKLPAGWTDSGPDGANVGRFSAGAASVAITALTSMEGKESFLVNMWRQVRGQPPLEETEAAKMLQDVSIAGTTGRMFEVSDEEGEKKTRFVVAFAHRPEGTLFFKIQGSDAEVTEQKPAFFEFLKSVQFAEGAAAAPVAPAPAPGPAEPGWPGKVPAGWSAVPAGPMQQVKYAVTADGGAKAEVTVSVFPSATGGTVENVKRWRRQLGLPEIDDAAAAALAKPLAGAPEGSIIVDLKNDNRAMLGAIIPRDGKWWFLKLSGDVPAVASARDAFVVFATSGS